MNTNKILMLLLFLSTGLCAFAQVPRGDSVDCSDRIGYSWMKSFGTLNDETANDVAVDIYGNIYVTGTYIETLTIQGQSVTSAGGTDFYVAKFTETGSIVWLKSGGSSNNDQGIAIAIDDECSVYIAGTSMSRTFFEDNAFVSRGDQDGFLLKLDTDGNFVFAQTIGSFMLDYASDLAIDNDNNVVVTGAYNFMMQFDSFSQDVKGGFDFFLVKFSSDGSFLWAANYASGQNDYGQKITCDNQNNIYVIGEFEGTMYMGASTAASAGEKDVFVTKYNSNGDFVWIKRRGATSDDTAGDICSNLNNEIYIAYNQPLSNVVTIEKLDNSGNLLSTTSVTGTGSVEQISMLCDGYQNLYLAGSYSGTINFGQGNVNSVANNFFIVRYASNGNADMQILEPQSNENNIKSICLDFANNIIACGDFTSNITINTDTEQAVGQGDALLIKYERYMSFGTVNITNHNCDPNNMDLQIGVIGGQEPLSYYWSIGSNQDFLQGISAGTYSLIVVDAANCYIQSTIELAPPTAPVLNLQNHLTICPYDTVTVAVNSGMLSYMWSNGASTQNINISDAGTYSVTVQSENTCTASATTVVEEYPNINIIADSDLYFCPEDTLSVYAGGFMEYYWSTGSSQSTLNTRMEGTFSVRVFNGICYYYDTVTTHKYESPNLNLAEDIFFCENDSVQIVAPSEFTDYHWSNGMSGQSIWVSNAGTLHLTITDINGCSANDFIDVDKVNKPNLNLGNDTTYCSEGKVVLEPTTALTNCSYLWNTGDVSSSIIVSNSGTYWLNATNSQGCSSTDTIRINIILVQPINLPDTIEFCDGTVTLTPENQYETYFWNTGETTQSIMVDGSGDISVTVTDVNGCEITDEVNVIRHIMILPFIGNDTVFCNSGTHRLYLNTTYQNYLWANSTTSPYVDISVPGTYSVTVTDRNSCTASTSLSADYSASPEIQNIEAGGGLVTVSVSGGTAPYFYSVDGDTWQYSNIFDALPSDFYTVIVMDNNHCTDSMQTYLDVSLGIPTFFTPNNDGYNDTWIITGLYLYPNSKVMVFDRYGKQLYTSNGPISEWDGIYCKEILPSDTYWYIISLGDGFSTLKGTVTIKR